MEVLFLPLKILLIAIDILFTIITFGWISALKRFLNPPESRIKSIPVGDDPSHRVKPERKGALVKFPAENITTLYDIAQISFNKYASVNCMGTREFLGWKTPKIKHFGETTWRTYDQVKEESDKFGAALAAAGLKPAPTTTTLEQVKTNSRIAIFEDTCAEWMIGALGAFSQSVTVVTVYATLGIESVAEAVDSNIVSVILCNKRNVGKLIAMKDKMPTLTTIVYTSLLVGPNDEIEIPSAPEGLKVVSFADFVASGDPKAYPAISPEAETTAVIMYTSGSTGKPKGVVITHSQIVSNCASAEIELRLDGNEQYVGYLPCAHIMEMMAEFVMLMLGCSIGYADPRSLSPTGAYPTGALEHFKPTLFIAVPKIWDTIKKGALNKILGLPLIGQVLIKTAIQWRTFAVKKGLDTPFFNLLVFRKLKAGVGGNLKQAISGGGPLNAEVQDFARACFSPVMVQGYGLTETCAGLSFQEPDDVRTLTVGTPIPCCEVKLVSTPDIDDKAGQPYLSTDCFDVEGTPVFGRGEICIRGNNVCSGYYMMPEVTSETFKEDGWFYTGDIGQFLTDGSLQIVDRKKNLVKLKGGEYIALEKMEMTYGNSKFVDAILGGICCYGDGDMDRPVALMQLNEVVTMQWAKDNEIDGTYEKVKKTKELMEAVMEDMTNEHSKSDLSHLEKLAGVVYSEIQWTPENGCLTAANKLQRRQVVISCEKEFQEVKSKGIF